MFVILEDDLPATRDAYDIEHNHFQFVQVLNLEGQVQAGDVIRVHDCSRVYKFNFTCLEPFFLLLRFRDDERSKNA